MCGKCIFFCVYAEKAVLLPATLCKCALIVTRRIPYIVLLLVLAGMPCVLSAEQRMLHCELGIDAGCGYYVGDATPHIFQNVRETYGANFRYMFTRRWAVRVKGMAHRITGYNSDGTGFVVKDNGMWTNQLINLDAVAEFNFFPFGDVRGESRIKPISPYIATGVGVCLHSKGEKVAAYMPFIVGLKWRCSTYCTLHMAWEHHVYFADNLENVEDYNNKNNLNGNNLMNVDVTGQLVVGVAVAFAREKRKCRTCE